MSNNFLDWLDIDDNGSGNGGTHKPSKKCQRKECIKNKAKLKKIKNILKIFDDEKSFYKSIGKDKLIFTIASMLNKIKKITEE
jgi:hypothetical protein